MFDFVSGNSLNIVLLEVKLYETKRENIWSPISEGSRKQLKKTKRNLFFFTLRKNAHLILITKHE